jgi:branched-subunit amino acid transport protein
MSFHKCYGFRVSGSVVPLLSALVCSSILFSKVVVEHDAVRKKLLFSNVLVEHMKVGIAENGRKRNKLGKQYMLSGRIIRSYRFSSKLGHALGVTVVPLLSALVCSSILFSKFVVLVFRSLSNLLAYVFFLFGHFLGFYL